MANAVMMFDPHVVYICGDIIDLAPDFLPDLIRKKILQKLYSRFLGVEIRTKLDVRDFLLFGSVGLVLTQPFRILEEENRRVRSVAYLEPILWRRENDA